MKDTKKDAPEQLCPETGSHLAEAQEKRWGWAEKLFLSAFERRRSHDHYQELLEELLRDSRQREWELRWETMRQQGLLTRAAELLIQTKQPLTTGWLDHDSQWGEQRDQWLDERLTHDIYQRMKDAGVEK